MVDKIVKRMGQGALDPAEVLTELHKGNVANFANGWMAEGVKRWNDQSIFIEIHLPQPDQEPYLTELTSAGIQSRQTHFLGRPHRRYFLPDDPSSQAKAWSTITKTRPITSMSALFQ